MIDAAGVGKLIKNAKTHLNDHNDCIQYALCRNPQPSCYLGDCKSCPDIKKFSTYIIEVLEQENIEQVIFSIWQATDRCVLKKECLSSEDFVVALSNSLLQLIPHHFISKTQSKYISERKEHLQQHEVLVQLDFSENYAYVTQNAVQAFHYNNDQCTVFPAVFITCLKTK